jgi:anthranilate phosphoribosyltransferase
VTTLATALRAVAAGGRLSRDDTRAAFQTLLDDEPVASIAGALLAAA